MDAQNDATVHNALITKGGMSLFSVGRNEGRDYCTGDRKNTQQGFLGVRFSKLGVRLEVTLRRITDAPSASFFRVLAASMMMRPTHATKNMGRPLYGLCQAMPKANTPLSGSPLKDPIVA